MAVQAQIGSKMAKDQFSISLSFTFRENSRFFFYNFDPQVKATHVVVGDKVDAEDLLVEIE